MTSTSETLSSQRTPASERIDFRAKSFPNVPGVTVETAAQQRWNFRSDFAFPTMVLREDALESNIAVMAQWCAHHGVLIAPHAKTTMSPQLVARQLAAGAWGITVATVAQARVFAEFGIERILVANEVVNRHDLQWLCDFTHAAPKNEVVTLVDSVASLRLMEDGLTACGHTGDKLPVLLELGYLGGRAGCRDIAEATALAELISTSAHVRIVGVEGFEGLVPGDSPSARSAMVRAFLDRLSTLVVALQDQGLLPDAPIVTCGGSTYFDLVAQALVTEWDGATITALLRSGCYVTHDHVMYAESSPLAGVDRPLMAALEVWSTVLSAPEDGLFIVGMGRRDVAEDAGLPILLRAWRGDVEVPLSGEQLTALNDHHAFLAFDATTHLRVGDSLVFGISHPCTAFDKWPFIAVVDADDIVTDVIKTYF